MIEMVEAKTKDFARINNIQTQIPAIGFYGQDENGIHGNGGLMWAHNRCWLWLQGVDMSGVVAGRYIVKAARQMLSRARALGETEVFCYRDDFEGSAKLLKLVGLSLLGFEEVLLTDGSKDEKELWSWLA